MSILRKISSFAATALVAVAPLCIGVCSAPLAHAAPSDTPVTSTSATNPAGQTQDLNDWTQKNCPGGAEFVNDIHENTPIYLGYANGETYLGYTNTTWKSLVDPSNQFIDAQTLKTVNEQSEEVSTYKPKIGTCVRVASDDNGQAIAPVYYGTLFTSDESALTSSGFSAKTQTVFQVTKVDTWEPGTKAESWSPQSGGAYQEMPHSLAKNGSDSGFKNLLLSKEDLISLRFSQAGFYTIHLKAITTDPQNPDKSYQTEMAYTFIVGKEASVPKDLQDIVDGNDGEGSDNPPTPDPGETTPDTPAPEPGDTGNDSHPGTNPTPNPGVSPGSQEPNQGDGNANADPGTTSTTNPATGSSSSRLSATNSARLGGSLTRAQLPRPLAGAFPTLPDLASSADAGSSAGNNAHSATPNPDSAAANGANSDSQAASGNPLKFQAANTSTKQAAQQWIRSSSLAVFVVGLAAAGLTGLGLLAFSRLHP